MSPFAARADELPSALFPAVRLQPDEDVAELQRRIEACLLIARHVAPAVAAAVATGAVGAVGAAGAVSAAAA